MRPEHSGLRRQRTIFVEGAGGRRPVLPPDCQRLERAASTVMSGQAFAYVAGGAGTEETMSANRRAFSQWRIVPRMLRDVSARQTRLTLLGRALESPFFLCPIGVLSLAHPLADLAVARAAARLDVPMIFSNQASYCMEECAEVMGDTPRWFQLYWSKSDDLVQSLVQRAERCGCSAIVVTLDTTLLGWRPRDLEIGYLPFLQGLGLAQYITDPVFQSLLDEPEDPGEPDPPLNLTRLLNFLRLCHNSPGSTLGNLKTRRPLKAVRKFIQIYTRPSLTWDDIPRLRDYTSLPIVLKGVLHPDDARKALDCGVDAVYVSNHGGRQVDGAAGAAEMLPSIVAAVDERAPVLYDSGIRGGADAFKALALGATAVGLGRPYVYGLALNGQAGVEEVLLNLMADLDLTMGLAGCTNLGDIRSAELRKA